MRTTDEVLDHHLKCFEAQDLKGTLADCAADAVFFGVDYELASDTFVIQAGSIQMQAFTAKIRAKR